MSRRYWTADYHFGHGNIIEFCKRPFKDVEHMNRHIIGNANMRAKEEDTLVHVGDFCTRGFARGVEGLRTKARDYLKQINATVVMVEGNHDKQNKTKTVCRYMFCDVGPQHALVTHYPTEAIHFPPALLAYAKAACNFVVCGHIHEKWAYKWIDGLLNINVGVDQHKFMPISDDELLVMVNKIKRNQYETSSHQ